MTVFLMVIGESMPPTSDKLPLIGLYYGVTISLVSFATGLSVVTLNLHHRGLRGRRVPRVLRYIVFNILARFLLIQLDDDTSTGKQQGSSLEKENSLRSEEELIFKALSEACSVESGSEKIPGVLILLMNRIHASLVNHETRRKQDEMKDRIRIEWQHCALVIDRFLLLVFTVGTIFATFE
ncbi:neuronal acetylcholine receptor subunit alpha-10 isoform X2 [Eurytemora carolleeae]|uniref:neuronal acetylcholine receptor subunit alpha-10 isoform X2 n=1 Tax=Eurytemora carolleeae TaxID=1294199 RepID=UPI000C77B0F7|nr:neuronal acetylcholine receptor subunit alpha-10 isoform X2 [Eurytemora carolleeae]|eukprot:XP_023330652.1 neuronal acetylcholine receptor subunit alpha-10-like isoform X2 [Eurytemora affinis]